MEWMEQAGAVFFVLALLGGTLWWLRSRGAIAGAGLVRLGGEKRLRSIERLPLTPQHSLHLVRFAGRALLVSSSPGGCTLLESKPWDEVGPSAEVRP